MYFGYEGEVPFFPIYVEIAYGAKHSRVTQTPVLFGEEQYYNWSIDQAARLVAHE